MGILLASHAHEEVRRLLRPEPREPVARVPGPVVVDLGVHVAVEVGKEAVALSSYEEWLRDETPDLAGLITRAAASLRLDGMP